jgi:hypothetical protein
MLRFFGRQPCFLLLKVKACPFSPEWTGKKRIPRWETRNPAGFFKLGPKVFGSIAHVKGRSILLIKLRATPGRVRIQI